ncbi:MAG: RNase A-like domain-containing protein, partial [Microcoleus sp.]
NSGIPAVSAAVFTPESSPASGQTTVVLQPKIPGGGLEVHEQAGGHTLERHVGKTEAQLAQRLAAEPRITAASSFTNRSVAEAAIGEALNRNERAISSWLRSRENRYTIDYDANRKVGITMRRRNNKASPTSRLKIILQRSTKLPPGYFILTAYPT